ncbi:MAG: LysM peptidoglycan-binding domain-containing protein [Bryobacterales bacterium]|nr:LysM peptidoglycan-binding domain-containing protein [Bryobacterales bacterium]
MSGVSRTLSALPWTLVAFTVFTASGALSLSEQTSNTVARAEQRLQQGRAALQQGGKDAARSHFDAAIDLMLDASETAQDRDAFERKLEQMVEAIHRLDLASLGPADLDEPKFEKSPLDDILDLTFPIDPKLTNKVREELQATASKLPLEITDAVLSYINYFSTKGHKTMISGLRRAGRYQPMIQRILDEEGVPPEILHLAQAESGFIPRAVSRKAATGMWQFLSWRGREYGLMQSPYHDDRLDPEKATRAAARHLRDLYAQFGDWYLAIAAYNCGPGNVSKAVERTGYANFWELRNRRVLPAETTNYVPIIVAMTIMVKNASEYGLTDIDPDPPLEYDTVEMTAPTHLALISDLTESPVYELQSLNPALLKNVAPEGYSLHVPKGTGTALLATLQTVPEAKRVAWRMHRVGEDETLSAIGTRFGASAGLIAQVNKMESPKPVPGDLLMIPAAPPAPPKPAVRRTTGTPASKRAAASKKGSTPAARAAAAKKGVKKSSGVGPA